MSSPGHPEIDDVAAFNDRLAREHDIDDYYHRSSLPIRLIEQRLHSFCPLGSDPEPRETLRRARARVAWACESPPASTRSTCRWLRTGSEKHGQQLQVATSASRVALVFVDRGPSDANGG